MPIVEIKDLRRLLPQGKRLMGLDHSKKRLGLALANPELTVVTPFKTLTGKNFTENIKALSALCREYNVGAFVIGLPLDMDGSEGPRAQSVRHFADNLLKESTALGFDPLIGFWDERLSTHAAQDLLEGGHADKVDAQAAAIILQDALDILNKKS